MKPTLTLLAAAALAVSSLPLAAQHAGAAAGQYATASAAGPTVSQSAGASAQADTSANAQAGSTSVQANGSASASAQMQPVNTELVSKLDSKSAKTGDAVYVKTTEKVRTAEGVVIPKGSRLVGHVTSVEAHGSGHAASTMSILFDHAEMKGGQSLAIHSVIQSVAPPVNTAAAGSLDSDSSFAEPTAGLGGRGAGGGRGGLVGGAVGSATSVTGGVASNVGATAGSAVNAAGGAAGEATANVAGGLQGAAGAAGAIGAHATAIPGVMLAGDASGSASGVLSASNRNIHLDSGTQIVMGLSAAAAAQ